MSKKYSHIAAFAYHPVWYHSGLYRAMDKAGLDITVLFCDKMGVESVYDDEFKCDVKWDLPLLDGYRFKFLKNLSKNRSGGRFFLRRINPALFTELRHYHVLLLHGFGTLSCLFALFAAKFWRLKIIWRGEATLADYDGVSPKVSLVKRKFVSWALARCDAIMYSCTGNREYLLAHGVPETKLFPIPCAVDNHYFQQQAKKLLPKRDKIRDDLGIPKDAFVIVLLSRLTQRKRPIDLLEAVNKLDPASRSRAYILMCGDGSEVPLLKEYANTHGLRVHFSGFIDHSVISRYYTISDLYVMLSSNDPSPKAMNEAMNFSLPVICTRAVGTAFDLVEDGKNGYLIDVGDISLLSQYIKELLNNRTKNDNYGKKSLEIVNRWTYESEVDGIKQALMNLRKQKGTR